MAVVLPKNEQQPLKTMLVEVGDKGQEEEAMDMGDICDGSSTSDSDLGENRGRHHRHILEDDEEEDKEEPGVGVTEVGEARGCAWGCCN